MRYPVRVFKDQNEVGEGESFSVFFRGLGGSDVGIWTSGETIEEAREMAAEALDGYILCELARRRLPPEPGQLGEGPEWEWCYPSLPIAAAVEIRRARKAAGKTQAQIAKILGISQQAYASLEDPEREGFSLSTLERVGKVLGRRLHIAFEAA